jgi:hypothetical protein
LAGAVGVVAGVSGAVREVSFFLRSMIVEENVRSLAMMDKLNEVSMKMAATTTVNLLKKLAGPRLPKTV